MFRRSAFLCSLVVVVLAATLSSFGQESKGRCRVYQTDGKAIEGVVTDYGNEVEIEIKSKDGKGGLKMRLKKTQIAKIEPLGADAAETADAGAKRGVVRAAITDDMVAQILGSENIDFSALDTEDRANVDVLTELECDELSVRDMLRVAGNAAKRYQTDHFIFVYTSELSLAMDMAGKLERIYRWTKTFNDMMGIKSKRPEHKLEIFFFGKFDEYEAYQAYTGSIMQGAIGFYVPQWPGSPGANRSAFFDMRTYPPFARVIEALKQRGIDPQMRRELTNKLNRLTFHYNREVVQHEAAHHIHFNMGTFSNLLGLPRWSVEGLAQMFETVESDVGASLGAINHARLYEFRMLYGENGERIPDMRIILLNDGWWFANGANAYPMGWALNHYLYKKHREKYRLWCQYLAQTFDDVPTITERQAKFEEYFGVINDDWTKQFVEYMKTIQLDRTAIPPEP